MNLFEKTIKMIGPRRLDRIISKLVTDGSNKSVSFPYLVTRSNVQNLRKDALAARSV